MHKISLEYQLITTNGVPQNVGFGSYGSVQLAKAIKTKQFVAIKKIYKKLAINQVLIHKTLNHPNIVKVIDFYFDEDQIATYLVLQYASNGTLFDFITNKGIKNKNIVKNIFREVCQAIQYMHQNGIMHRDIKPENILLDKSNHVKMCDFGFAAAVEPRMTLCGTVQYMAPQMILKTSHNHKVDIWGLGILLFQIIEGHAPFQGSQQQTILEKMKSPLFFSQKFQKQQIQLIHKILRVDPKDRPEIHQILQNEWFQKSHRSSKNSSHRSKRSTQQQENKIKLIQVKEVNEEKMQNSVPFYHYQIPDKNNNKLMKSISIKNRLNVVHKKQTNSQNINLNSNMQYSFTNINLNYNPSNYNQYYYNSPPQVNKNIIITNLKVLPEEEEFHDTQDYSLKKQSSSSMIPSTNKPKSQKFSLKKNNIVSKK